MAPITIRGSDIENSIDTDRNRENGYIRDITSEGDIKNVTGKVVSTMKMRYIPNKMIHVRYFTQEGGRGGGTDGIQIDRGGILEI